MTPQLGRAPTRLPQWVAIALCVVSMVGFGLMAALVLGTRPHSSGSMVAGGIFFALFSLSAFMLYRSASTVPKALSSRQSTAVAWFLLLMGIVSFPLSFAPGVDKLLVLGCGFSALAYGLGGIARRQRL